MLNIDHDDDGIDVCTRKDFYAYEELGEGKYVKENKSVSVFLAHAT